MATIFYNETGLNGKFEVVSTTELNFIGKITKVNQVPNQIHLHKGETMKNLNRYWVDKKAYEAIKNSDQSERTHF